MVVDHKYPGTFLLMISLVMAPLAGDMTVADHSYLGESSTIDHLFTSRSYGNLVHRK